MPWLQLSLDTSPEKIERVSEAMLQLGALSVTLGDAADQPVYEPQPGETKLWDNTRVTGLFEATVDPIGIRQRLASILGTENPAGLCLEILEDQVWERVWLQHFQPMRFGERLWIVPKDSPPGDRGPESVALELDPGLAFGTGSHPTTALCLEWLDQNLRSDVDIIDYGSGSGILAIAALRLGARHAWAIDNDPQALLATRDNATQNGVLSALTAAAPEELPEIRADLLVANILASTLVELAACLAAHVRPRGHIALCGILANQAEDVVGAYRSWFVFNQPVVKEGWIRLDGTRR